jgi:endo-1,4-beta-D-glucanase Y
MNRLLKAASMVLFALMSLGAQNLLQNPGFETSGGWDLWVSSDSGAQANLSYVTTGAQEGTTFARVTVTKISSLNWHIQLQDPVWPAKKGVQYHFSFYAKADSTRSIQVAVSGDSASPYTYRAGTTFSLNNSWKKIDCYYKSDVEGSGNLSFNIYCGYSTGVYDFDNTLLEENSVTLPTTIAPQAQSAWESKKHRDLFSELGYTQEQIDAKVNSSFQQLFFGDHSTEAVYTGVGDDMGFINQPGGGSIITEGQSYGMMITIQMNRQDIFDKLWKFAYTYMLHHSGDRKGMFSWKVNETSPYSMIDQNPAPDGEEYFVTSLLFAARRWGNKTGIYNYQEQADSILTDMLHKTANNTVVAEINQDHAMIVFTPAKDATQFTDPSYHLPAFYSVWEKYASHDNEFWKKMADSSRAYFKRASNTTTGLSSDYTAFDGTPFPVDFNRFAGWYHSDSWRTPMNIAVDYAWCKVDSWETEQSVRTLKFFDSQNGDYLQTYRVDGTPVSETDDGTMTTYNASAGQIACNAVSALASDDPIAWKYVDRLWKTPMVTGEWRYFSGLLTMMGLLHVSGKFQIWGNVISGIHHYNEHLITKSSASTVKGPITILDLNGKIVRIIETAQCFSSANISSLLQHTFSRVGISNRIFIVRAQRTDGSYLTERVALTK